MVDRKTIIRLIRLTRNGLVHSGNFLPFSLPSYSISTKGWEVLLRLRHNTWRVPRPTEGRLLSELGSWKFQTRPLLDLLGLSPGSEIVFSVGVDWGTKVGDSENRLLGKFETDRKTGYLEVLFFTHNYIG